MELITDPIELSRRALSEKGRLSTALPGFVSRQAQIDLAVATAEALEAQSLLVAEAGTGTGKTFAYLIPCLLSNKKALISTATKTLQDQLYSKDIPILIKALGLSLNVQILKGRANYICHYRTELHSSEGSFQSSRCVEDILHVQEKIPQLQHGDRSELPELKEDSPAWPFVTSTTENCLGNECPSQEECFLLKARKKAMKADIVVINHHLFFADSQLKSEGFGELLPGVDIVVFDEAHQLVDIAVNFYGERLGTRQFQELVDDIIKEWPGFDLANQPLKQLKLKVENLFSQLLAVIPERTDRLSWHDFSIQPAFQRLWTEWMELKDELVECLAQEPVDENSGLKRCRERLERFDTIFNCFNQEDRQRVRWLERFKKTMVFHSTPYEVAEPFQMLMKQYDSAFLFTSATLTMAESFECFTKPLGLNEARTLALPSPFDYQQQALLYLPRALPDTKDRRYHRALLDQVLPMIKAFGGRAFFLFTSHRALREVAEMIEKEIDFPVLVQGDEAKPILLSRFRQAGNAVLLGTATFWEGVDVKGEALSCVIIDKLPFSSPHDPVIRAKMAYLKSQGLSAFDELSLPNAVIALKQGVGRLIRDHDDRGLLIIGDPRLTGREYGRLIMSSLPKMTKTRDERRALEFINQLTFKQNEECTSD